MRQWLKKLQKRFFDMNVLPLKLVLFNVVIFMGIVGGCIGFTLSILIESGPLQIASIVLVELVLVLCFYLANWKQYLNASVTGFTAIVTLVLFPVMFLINGGAQGGMGYWYAIGILFTFLLVDGIALYVLIVLQILICSATYVFGYYFPEYIVKLESDAAVVVDMLQSMLVLSIAIGLIIRLQSRIYKNALEKIERQNEELKLSEQKAEKANRAKTDFLSNMSRLLKPTNVQVVCAGSGRECLQLVTEQRYDLIFMDHMMPEMDGIETFHEMQRLSDGKNPDTPVIMLTANAISGMKEKYLAEGFAGYLSKPIDGKALANVLLTHLPPEKVVLDHGTDSDEEQERASEAGLRIDGNGKNEEKEDGNMQELGRFSEMKQKNPDFDLESALGYCSGVEEFYVELLEDFVTDERKADLIQAYESKDWDSYETKIHTIKGTMRTLGFPALGDVAEGLQHAAERKEEAYLAEHHQTAVALFENVLECVKRL